MKDAEKKEESDVVPPAPAPEKKKRKSEPEVVIAPSQPGGPDVSIEYPPPTRR